MNAARVLVLAVLWQGATELVAAKPVDAMECSIRPKHGTAAPELAALARVSKEEAQTAALVTLNAPAAATVVEGELEVERGCLVFSFDIRLPGREGIEEVMVDAGSGKVLSTTHESAQHEAAEKAKDAAKKAPASGSEGP